MTNLTLSNPYDRSIQRQILRYQMISRDLPIFVTEIRFRAKKATYLLVREIQAIIHFIKIC